MGVYIKDMEMPNSCSNCELCACYTESKGEVYRCDITMTPVKHFEKRLHDCPLVEVPPHGDLIDRDAIPWRNANHPTAEKWVDELHVRIMPTIIEEEGKHE